MNYYNRHIGDYAKQTSHLTFAEDGAYNRMLDYYYTSEKPLPLDREFLYRKVRARGKADKEMIDRLLEEFFSEREDGWHKKRCDEEIEKYQRKAEKNRENGPKGGRPPKPKANPTETQLVSKENPNETLASSQKPVAKNQEPEAKTSKSTPLAPSDESPGAAAPVNSHRKNGHPKPFQDGPTVIAIPLIGDAEYEVHQSLVDELERLYPAVDVPQTLREIRGWNLARPRERKTPDGILKHINTWLKKEQNRG